MRMFTPLAASLILSMTTTAVDAKTTYDQFSRKQFNLLAQEANIPLFWRDEHQSNNVNPEDIVYLQGMRPDKTLGNYVTNGKFTPEFDAAYLLMAEKNNVIKPSDVNAIKCSEDRRRALVVQELNQAEPSLIESDFSHESAEDKAVVQHMLNISAMIENIYLRQNGVYEWQATIPVDDTASKTMFYRNHGPFCLSPKTENNPECNALPTHPKRIVGIYPAELQKDKTFCNALQNESNGAELMQPFVGVTEDNGKLVSRPYTIMYQTQTQQIARELRVTAQEIKNPNEDAFKNYLNAAAQAFEDNKWYAADEAWTKMNATNSKWYLRIGPDEQYWEPCSSKAGFHLSFATINKDSLIWQQKLDPIKNEMEDALAQLAGEPYKARVVSFHLPDFIDVVLNNGDSRHNTGATIGQSLPNSGPVANEGRGRTVVMTNLTFPNEDSKQDYKIRSAALLCKGTADHVIADPKIFNMTIVLHEAAHNLGPAHEYKVNGKTDREIFGGPMASMLEELKAETSAHFFTDWLANKKMIDQQTADQAHLNGLLWAFGHIAQGMYTGDGDPKTYSQLAAIQFGSLVNGEAVVWHDDQLAANGQDRGCFDVDLNKFRSTMTLLEKDVLHVKAAGDKQKAESMKKSFVDDEGELKRLRGIITERVLRTPAKTLVYSIHQ